MNAIIWSCPPYFNTVDIICLFLLTVLGAWKGIELINLTGRWVERKIR